MTPERRAEILADAENLRWRAYPGMALLAAHVRELDDEITRLTTAETPELPEGVVICLRPGAVLTDDERATINEFHSYLAGKQSAVHIEAYLEARRKHEAILRQEDPGTIDVRCGMALERDPLRALLKEYYRLRLLWERATAKQEPAEPAEP